MKPVGLVATHSPLATSLLLHEFHEQFQVRFPGAAPLPKVIHELHGHAIEMAIRRQDETDIVRLTTLAARQCQAAGALGLLLGGSVLHIGAAKIARSVRLPLFDLADAALDEVVGYSGVSRVGLIGTRLPAEDDYWRGKAKLRGLAVALPGSTARKSVETILRNEANVGHRSENVRSEIARACAELQAEGAGIIVSVVPKLKLLIRPQDTMAPVIHAMELQVAKAIGWATGTAG